MRRRKTRWTSYPSSCPQPAAGASRQRQRRHPRHFQRLAQQQTPAAWVGHRGRTTLCHPPPRQQPRTSSSTRTSCPTWPSCSRDRRLQNLPGAVLQAGGKAGVLRALPHRKAHGRGMVQQSRRLLPPSGQPQSHRDTRNQCGSRHQQSPQRCTTVQRPQGRSLVTVSKLLLSGSSSSSSGGASRSTPL